MTDQRWMLRNIARRPIELHDAATVTIVPADGAIEVDSIDDRHAALIDRGLMTAHPAPAASPAAAPASPKRSGKTPKTPTRTSRGKGEGA